MYSLNKVQVIGNLTRDPEMRQIPSGQMVCNVGVATNRVWKNTNGEKQEEVEFHNITLWGKLAEIAGQYVKKGQKVYIEGRLKTSSWENDQGAKQYKTEIVGSDLIMLSPRGTTAEGQSFGGGISASAPVSSEVPAGEKVKVEDLPF
jgi:single-strand DNA-binding protein